MVGAVPATAEATLTPERIVEEALRLMDANGVEWLTMRRLGDALGVRAPTLYWHVPSKKALQDACVEQTLKAMQMPVNANADWRQQTREFMHSVRSQLGQHPSIIDLMHSSHPPAMGRMSAHALQLMRTAGLDWAQAYLYCRLMIWRVVGFTGMEHALRRSSTAHKPDPGSRSGHSRSRFQLVREWPAGAPPEARALSTRVDLDEMFDADVEIFIRGVAAVTESGGAFHRAEER